MRRPAGRAALAIGVAALLAAPGCSFVGGPSGASLVSVERPVKLTTRLTSQAYVAIDENTADIYLTDLSDEQLDAFFDPSGAWGDFEGQVIHIHLFVEPKPGKTPIDDTAISATVRTAVLAGGEIGIYAGGGFLAPRGDPGDRRLAGRIADASVRLSSSTPGFNDLLGPALNTVRFSATLDDEAAERLRVRLEALATRAARP